MTRARWIIASSWLLLFWLIAGAVWAPALQRQLEASATTSLRGLETGYPAVTVTFSGQHAHLSGKVRHPSERQEIESRIAEKLKAPGLFKSAWNPVARVRNDIAVFPYPPGWLLLAAQGPRAIVHGTLASDYEARDISQQIQDRWAKLGGRITSQFKTDFSRFDEAPGIQPTLDQLPPPRHEGGGDTAQVHLARPGTLWERLTLDAPDDLLRQQFASYPISDAEWEKYIQPALAQTRRYQQNERARIAEAAHQASLPPPHVFFAARDKRLLIRGELASLKIKRELLNLIIGTFPEWRVLDDLRVNDQRRAVAEFGPITTALLPLQIEPTPGKSLALGLSGSAWQFVDWQVGADGQPWKALLPPDLPPALLQEDSRMVTQWLQGNAQGIPTLPIPAQPSFLTLTLLPDKVILAGQLAEEGLRTQLIEAARRAYAGQAVIFSEALLARGTCQPTTDVEQTIRSFPHLPQENDAPVVAFAQPGQVWKSLPATEALLAPGALSKSGLTPLGFPAAMAEDTFAAEAYDHIRHHLRQPPTPVQENPAR
ncbi:hypothetical protein EI77_00031 [Prosthecobacter fusiformis]|uniref:BON domain-containing protein n=1 Tax=Prosthecobacter fusiformis TaxID=48464 RepID=A0A4R7SPA8_9BACT|nr:hypothetical protein [Prosthecobacter fusiformis]TDU80734.1 hypothetical protein EI77_00031 [Prosthecobacter fusiformis]